MPQGAQGFDRVLHFSQSNLSHFPAKGTTWDPPYSTFSLIPVEETRAKSRVASSGLISRGSNSGPWLSSR